MRTMPLAAATFLSLGIAAAEARPIVVVEPVVARPVVLVGGGCGFGFHRGPYGGCVRNGGGVVVERRVFPRYVMHCGPRWTAFGWRRGCHY